MQVPGMTHPEGQHGWSWLVPGANPDDSSGENELSLRSHIPVLGPKGIRDTSEPTMSTHSWEQRFRLSLMVCGGADTNCL